MSDVNRRELIKRIILGGFGAALTGIPPHSLASSAQSTPNQMKPLLASAFTTEKGEHFVGLIDNKGELFSQFSVPSRGHSCCVTNDKSFVAFFSRRPRRWMLIVDLRTGELVSEQQSPEGRHFYGHGVFSKDDRYLYTTENDFENNRGLIGIYDCKDKFRRLGELSSHGLGPHEICLSSNGRFLIVANGGIQTHPDYGRQKLNLDTMAPSLVYIDIASGNLIEKHTPPHHQLSLRHLAMTADDTVIIGAQFQGRRTDDHPLVFAHELGKTIEVMGGQPLTNQRRLNQYVASVGVLSDSGVALTTSPRGNRVSMWDIKDRAWIRDVEAPDIGGVASYSKEKAVLTSGNGTHYQLNAITGTLSILDKEDSIYWDNHLIRVL